MANHTEKINKRHQKIHYMECETLHDISEDLDELMDGNDIEFDKPICTNGFESKWFNVYGITYMPVTDEEGEVVNEVPAFYVGYDNHIMNVECVPYSVALNVYRTVLKKKEQS